MEAVAADVRECSLLGVRCEPTADGWRGVALGLVVVARCAASYWHIAVYPAGARTTALASGTGYRLDDAEAECATMLSIRADAARQLTAAWMTGTTVQARRAER